MTAINVLMDRDRVHVFSDGGHFDGPILRQVAPKVYTYPELNALLCWSGKSLWVLQIFARLKILPIASLPELLKVAPALIASFGFEEKFSLIIVGVHNGIPMGVTIEEGGKVIPLAVGNVVKSLYTNVPFDIRNIKKSGVEMIKNQRELHKVVAGFIQYSTVKPNGKIRIENLHLWPDIEVGGYGETHAVKIQNLSVDTINFANRAVTGLVDTATSIIVPNEQEQPVTFYAVQTILISGNVLGAPTGGAACEVRVRRTRGSKILFTLIVYVPNGSYSNTPFTVAETGTDILAEEDDEYYFQNVYPTGTSGTFIGGGTSYNRSNYLQAVYKKK